MRYVEPLSNQVLMFIRSIGPGVLIGLIYDVIFSFFRAFSTKRPVIIAADLCFSVVATLLSFFYMVIYNSGTVRLNIIIAQMLGAVAFHYTLGKYVARPIGFMASLLGKAVALVCYPVIFLYRWLRQTKVKAGESARKKIEEKKKKQQEKKKLKQGKKQKKKQKQADANNEAA